MSYHNQGKWIPKNDKSVEEEAQELSTFGRTEDEVVAIEVVEKKLAKILKAECG